MEALIKKIKASVYLHAISRTKIFIYVATISITLSVFSLTPWGDSVDSYLAHALEFSLRSSLNAYPKLDPRIKIFIFDDPMASYLKGNDYDLDGWATVIEGVAKQKPAAIIIDKLFGFPLAGDPEVFVKRVRDTQTPVVIGAFATAVKVKERPLLKNVPHETYSMDFSRDLPATAEELRDESKIMNLYSADPKIRLGFSKFGHIVYGGNGYIYPYLRFSKEQVVPHLSFHLAKDFHFSKQGQPIADGKEVPVDRKGRIMVDLAPSAYYQSKTYGLKALYVRAKKNHPIPVVSENDVVIILPSMFTGNTDWVSTPSEDLQGGYLLTSTINSAITGNYIKKIEFYAAHIFLACLFGVFFASYLVTSWFWLALAGSSLFLIGAGLFVFINFAVILPWLYPLFAMTSSAMVIFAERSRNEKFEQVRIEKDLETARLVQDSFFPKENIHTDQIHVIGYRESAAECSGDWWYHLKSVNGSDYLFIADAMGHGTPAALLTAMAYASVLSLINRDSKSQGSVAQPSQILTELNKIIYDALHGKVSMSVFAALIDPEHKTLVYANAGHPFPILMPANNPKPVSIRGSLDPLGVNHDAVYVDKTMKVSPGDKILAFTDGLIEAQDAKKQKWGRKKLFEILEKSQGTSNSQVCENVIAAARAFHGSTFEEDDVTFFIAEIGA